MIAGFAVRILLQRFNKAYFATVAFAVLTLVGWVVYNVVPSYGSELNGILAMQATAAFASSLLTGLVLKLKSKTSLVMVINIKEDKRKNICRVIFLLLSAVIIALLCARQQYRESIGVIGGANSLLMLRVS